MLDCTVVLSGGHGMSLVEGPEGGDDGWVGAVRFRVEEACWL